MKPPIFLRLCAALASGLLLGQAVSAATHITYAYDELDRLVGEQRDDGPQLARSFDVVGNITAALVTGSPDTDGDGVANLADDDDDGDGLPDAWEEANGLDPLEPADALLDIDGDGRDALTEFADGTDPNTADSPVQQQVPLAPVLMLVLLAGLLGLRGAQRTRRPEGGGRVASLALGALLLGSAVATFWPLPAGAALGPGWHYGTDAEPVSPAEARAFYGEQESTAVEFFGLPQGTPEVPLLAQPQGASTSGYDEIAAVAEALERDPRRIYQFVRNEIRYTPYFGAMKGAYGTLLERSGNDFDQAALLVALLRAAGHSAEFRTGDRVLPLQSSGDQVGVLDWLDAQDAVQATQLFASGAVPVVIQGSSSLIVTRVWVRATVLGVTYELDPALKRQRAGARIPLLTAMGYQRTSLLAALGGSVTSSSIANMNVAALGSTLNGLTGNLLAYLRGNHANDAFEDVLGGVRIERDDSTSLRSTPPNWTSVQTWQEIPEAYLHKLTLTHGGLVSPGRSAVELATRDVAGRKLAITYAGATARNPQTESVASPVQPNGVAASGTPPAGTVDFGVVNQSILHGSPYVTRHSFTFPSSRSWEASSTISHLYIQRFFTGGHQGTTSFVANPSVLNQNIYRGQTVSQTIEFAGHGQARGPHSRGVTCSYIINYNQIVRLPNGTLARAEQQPCGLTVRGVVAESPNIPATLMRSPSVAAGMSEEVSFTLRNESASQATTVSVADLRFFDAADAAHFRLIEVPATGLFARGESRIFRLHYQPRSAGSHRIVVHLELTHDGLSYPGWDYVLQFTATAPPRAQLWLDDELLAEEPAGTLPSTSAADLVLAVDHPYAQDGGTFADQSGTYNLTRGSTYVIASGFGVGAESTTLTRRQKQLDAYAAEGFANDSRQMLTETLNVAGQTWMRQTSLNQQLLSAALGTRYVNHHRFGIVAQEAGYYIDVKNQLMSTTAPAGVATGALLRAEGQLASAMEHGVWEQMQGAEYPAASTIKLFTLNNTAGDPLFFANAGNFGSIRNQLAGYSETQLAAFQAAVTAGDRLVLPKRGDVRLNQWQGVGYIQSGTRNGVTSVAMAIGGDYMGGYGSVIRNVNSAFAVKTVFPQIQLPAFNFTPKAADPVDLGSGAYVLETTDLAIGGLAFSRSYNSQAVSQNRAGLGRGWTHGYDMYLSFHSDVQAGLGTRTPQDAAALIVAAAVTADLMNVSGDPAIAHWGAAALTADWAMQQLLNNAVSVHTGDRVLTYIEAPDGSYIRPPGVTTDLVKVGATYELRERFGTVTAFNAAHRVSRVTDIDGNAITFAYTGDRLTRVTDDVGRYLTLNYSGSRLASVSDSTGRSVSFQNTGEDLTQVTDVAGEAWLFRYDGEHRVWQAEDPLGVVYVDNVYDALGRVVQQFAPREGGSSATYRMHYTGSGASEEAPDGTRTRYTYDRHGRTIATESAAGEVSRVVYDGQGQAIETVDAAGNVSRASYDARQNRISSVDALGRQTGFSYDAQDRLIRTTDALGHASEVDYDAEHHPLRVRDALGHQASTSYLADGRAESRTNPRGVLSVLGYDVWKQPLTSRTGSQPVITQRLSERGWLESVVDAAGARTEFRHDARGVVTERIDPYGARVVFEPDALGRVVRQVDRNGDVVSTSYTPSGKVDVVGFGAAARSGAPGFTVDFGYDALDRVVSMVDSLGTAVNVYEAGTGRLIETRDSLGGRLRYGYDAAGRLSRMTWPDGRSVSYRHDALNRVAAVRIDWLGVEAVPVYDAAGRLSELRQFNGTVTRYTHDAADRLTGVRHERSGGVVFAGFGYGLDANGNRISETREPEVVLPGGLIDGGLSQGFDAAGQQLVSHRAAAGGEALPSYSPEGQLESLGDSGFWFDAAGRLIEVATGTSSSRFDYDGAGNRLRAVRDGVTTRYLHDAGGNVVAEMDGSGAITRYYIHGLGLLAMVQAAGPNTGLYVYHADGTGHVVALTDSSGEVANAYSYGSFGERLDGGQAIRIEQPFTYAGLVGVMAEPAHGLHYMRARYYHVASHRFVNEDPSGFNGGLNLYAYVGGNPLGFVDPSGLAGQEFRNTPTVAMPGAVNPFSAGNLLSAVGPASKLKAGGFIAGALTTTLGPSSRALGRALVLSGVERPAGAVAHHLVAARAAAAAPARAVLAKFGIGLDDAVNGAFMAPAAHARLHTKAYYRRVNELLEAAQSPGEAIDALARIRSGL